MSNYATVIQITDPALLPETFRSYWLTDPKDGFGPPCQYRPEWTFWLVDGDYLYIASEKLGPDGEIASHWTQTNCAGVANFMRAKKIAEQQLPYVHVPSGQRSFEVVAGGYMAYRTDVRLDNGVTFTVHSG